MKDFCWYDWMLVYMCNLQERGRLSNILLLIAFFFNCSQSKARSHVWKNWLDLIDCITVAAFGNNMTSLDIFATYVQKNNMCTMLVFVVEWHKPGGECDSWGSLFQIPRKSHETFLQPAFRFMKCDANEKFRLRVFWNGSTAWSRRSASPPRGCTTCLEMACCCSDPPSCSPERSQRAVDSRRGLMEMESYWLLNDCGLCGAVIGRWAVAGKGRRWVCVCVRERTREWGAHAWGHTHHCSITNQIKTLYLSDAFDESSPALLRLSTLVYATDFALH